MNSAETLKAARLLSTLARPLWSAAATVGRNAGEFARDIRPGALTPRLDRFAAGMGSRAADAASHTAGMGFLGRSATGLGQMAVGAAPVIGAATFLPPAAMPIWNTLANAGSAGGQALRWGADRKGTEEAIREGARDQMVQTYAGMQGLGFGDRRGVIDQFHQGQGVGMENGAYAAQNGNPWGFREGLRQLAPSGSGDMRGYLTRQALQYRAQQQAKSGHVKLAGRLDLIRSGLSALWHGTPPRAFPRGSFQAPHANPRGIPASQQTIDVGSLNMRPPALPMPGGPLPAGPGMSAGQLAGKWGWRGTKSLAMAAPLPLAFGAIQGYSQAPDVARQVGGDMAMNEFQQNLRQQGGLGRLAFAADPSLMLNSELYGAFPDFKDRYEKMTGQPLQHGALSRMRHTWNNPSFLASDSTGSYNLPNPLPFT